MVETRTRVLLADDDIHALRRLALRLTAAGFDLETVDSGVAALSRVSVFRPHVVVADLGGEAMDSMGLFDALHSQYPTLPVILMTAHGTIGDAVHATRRGVFGFLAKPVDKEELVELIQEATRIGLVESGGADPDLWRKAILTQSPAMEELLSQAQRIAQSKASVFIGGESGTGKELLARAIHDASTRRDGSFVAVNCSAIPENLLESELFGHRKGAFTGATRDHKGLFRAADGGTLFLDEIGDMPRSFQVKLLRALQEMKVRPVGATEDETVDVRIISATHADLDKAMAEGNFREDLYYRLNVVTLRLPRLAQRQEDIPLLAAHFIRELAETYGDRVKGFSPEAMEMLVGFDWPGNVRQLRNLVEQCVALSTTPLIPLTLVQRALRDEPAAFLPLQEARDQFERNYLIRLLQMTHGNVTQAAKLAKRNRTEFYRLLNRHGMNPALFKTLPEGPEGEVSDVVG
ncbi:two-component system, NtrC family, response regulator GlrR [Methylomagnum ishizawai]|uniref:Two-component system, NtrC family, response regulator GlrR n=1 Tax=Methylomagnum ishizawai TaxID=1760988 RepID=A0A1Y6CX27_9GAMM|nr:sigma 54-interacting transcriptional regulator [Methylomagnum ishizawai]SMF94921.1 two-component system, NtrC family, response regulator GlrR [Methylomagnum ishizawai]